jgi:hypothetical protein
MMTKPKTDIEAFTLALQLAVSAPTDDQSNKALSIANKLAAKLTKEQIEIVKSKLEVKTLQ